MGTVITVDRERMVGFGYKTGWLAFNGADPDKIVAALGGQILRSLSWTDGVDRSYTEADTVLITPILPGAADTGWILVAGQWIGEHADDLDTAALSAELGGQVQLFVTHRVVELHRWERAVDGELVRSLEYVGERDEITRWHGQPHDVELDLGLPASDPRRDPTLDPPAIHVDEDDLMRIAAAWSVDPTGLEGQSATAGLTLARLPVTTRERRAAGRPLRPPIPVDVTDLVISGRSIEDVNAELAQRTRQQTTWPQRLLDRWRRHLR